MSKTEANRKNILALAETVARMEEDVLHMKKSFQHLQGLISTLNLRVANFQKTVAKIAQDKYGTGPTA